jgi:hypothetical protein
MLRPALVLSLTVAGLALGVASAPAATTLAGCPLFPASSPWNQDVSQLPVAPQSDAWVASIGTDADLHPDFGTQYGIPYKIVARTQKRVPVHVVAYPDESDRGPAPIPLSARVENGSDAHVLVLQRGTCLLTELFAARRAGRGWAADAVARWNTRSNKLRPPGWTSADAAGLPILPGLARAGEVIGARHAITHALRFTARRTQDAYIAPARHAASSSDSPELPPMGARFRLKASFDLSRFTGQAKVVLTALKRYGMILADNGSPWYITGAPDPRWDDDDLHVLNSVSGSAFEAVQTGPVVAG